MFFKSLLKRLTAALILLAWLLPAALLTVMSLELFAVVTGGA